MSHTLTDWYKLERDHAHFIIISSHTFLMILLVCIAYKRLLSLPRVNMDVGNMDDARNGCRKYGWCWRWMPEIWLMSKMDAGNLDEGFFCWLALTFGAVFEVCVWHLWKADLVVGEVGLTNSSLCWLGHPVDCCNKPLSIHLLDKENYKFWYIIWLVFCWSIIMFDQNFTFMFMWLLNWIGPIRKIEVKLH